jgi:hypothetical protein
MKPYLILLDTIFILLYVGVMLALNAMDRIPQDIRVLDLVLLGLAAARLTDVISTDEIMTWLREPFVQLESMEVAGHEIQVRTGRGRGLRRTIGEMFACPWCVGVWVAAGLTYAFFLWPTVVWLFILLMAIAEVGSLLQSISTVIVRVEKYMKAIGVPEEDL